MIEYQEYGVYEEAPTVQVVSKTSLGRYEYTVTYSIEGESWDVICTDTVSNKFLLHGPFDEAGALAMVASRVAREEELKR